MSNGLPEESTEPQLVISASRLSRRDLVFRLVVMIVLVASLALAWWSLAHVLAPRLQESRNLISSVSDLQKQIDLLERKFSPAQIQEITNRFRQVPQQLFGSPAALEQWLSNLRDQALPLGLDLQTEIGKPLTQSAGGRKFALVPASVNVEALPGASNIPMGSACQRILRLTQFLAAQEKRTDLVELTALSTGTNSISRATLLLHCWAGEEAAR